MINNTNQNRTPDTDRDENSYLEEARSIFSGKIHEFGPIEHPNKRGLLALAKEGHRVWNAWRNSYPEKDVDFSDIDFSLNPVNFSNFVFISTLRSNSKKPHKTIFKGATFGDHVEFANATFSDITIFSGCIFNGSVNFSRSIFGMYRGNNEDRPQGVASFNNCQFKGKVNFSDSAFVFSCKFVKCHFGEESSFKRAQFTWVSHFIDCDFDNRCNFSNSIFSNASDFRNSRFQSGMNFTFCVFFGFCNFEKTKFKDSAKFIFSYFGRGSSFLNSCLGVGARFDGAIFSGDANFSSSQQDNSSSSFSSIFFCGAQFRSKADFSGRVFLMKTDFGPTQFSVTLPENHYSLWNKYRYVKDNRPVRFYGIVNFHDCKFQQDTSFEKSEFYHSWTSDSARAYRSLKLAMEQLKATREEQRFFRLEIKSERHSLKGLRWIVSTVYEWCSDYGFSIWRPTICLLLASMIIGSAHGALSNVSLGATWRNASIPIRSEINSRRTHAIWQYVAINSIPVPGLDKTQQTLRDELFKSKTMPKITTIALALEIAHKVISLAMVFLIGLALRNLFKMKL